MTDWQHWQVYHKIHAPFKRHTSGPDKGKFIWGEWSKPEFGYLANNQWLMVEKCDGTCVRIIVRKNENGTIDGQIGGKTDNANLHKDLLKVLDDESTKIANWALTWDTPGEMIFYGEGYGPGIQKGGTYRDDKAVIFYDIRAGGLWLERSNVVDICSSIGLSFVPLVGEGTLWDAIGYVTDPDFYSVIAEKEHAPCEGLVITPAVPLQTRRGERILMKVKKVDFVG